MADQTPKLHAIVIPYPLQGHVIPTVHVATKLASRGFRVTFINTESIHHQTARARPGSSGDVHLFAAASAAGLDIRYRTVPDGLPVEFDRSLNHDQFMAALLHVFSAHVGAAVAEIVAEESSAAARCFLMADTFFVWPSKVAKKYGLVYVSYWTEPALVFSLYYHMHLLRDHRHFDCPDPRKDTIDYIPGVESIDPKDITSYLQSSDTTTIVHQIISAAFDDARGADFVLSNTVQDLEPQTIQALQAYSPFYAIGPVFSDGLNVATSLWSESDCTQWLDSKPRGSVLYVSFGSYAHVTKRDLWEIAYGLSLSNVSFVWVLRPDIVSSDNADPLPVGFREEVSDRSMIISWCRQVEVLAHPAVGGFLTHCGWNSILESVWSLVPLLCFPLLTDQFTNRKLVADDWRIGISLSSQGSVTRGEISEKIKSLISGESGCSCREAVRKVKATLENALTTNGSSEKNMDQFISDLRAKIHN